MRSFSASSAPANILLPYFRRASAATGKRNKSEEIGSLWALLNSERMNAHGFGKKLGIGVRVAGRMAQQRAQQQAHHQAKQPGAPASAPRRMPSAAEIRDVQRKTHQLTRAAGRGVGGFLRPFGRVGGILWLEVTGFFFGLFALYFALDLWRARMGYAAGPLHPRFLIAAALTALFGYLSASAFWRARQK